MSSTNPTDQPRHPLGLTQQQWERLSSQQKSAARAAHRVLKNSNPDVASIVLRGTAAFKADLDTDPVLYQLHYNLHESIHGHPPEGRHAPEDHPVLIARRAVAATESSTTTSIGASTGSSTGISGDLFIDTAVYFCLQAFKSTPGTSNPNKRKRSASPPP